MVGAAAAAFAALSAEPMLCTSAAADASQSGATIRRDTTNLFPAVHMQRSYCTRLQPNFLRLPRLSRRAIPVAPIRSAAQIR
ncbi:Uncharacterised protein [Mycobacterium tuberculosis]|nr:Uncharacterised protein [Mycobacterium tuberculosis]